MNPFNRFLAGTFLSAPMLFAGAAQAMEMQQFDKMSGQDRSDYVPTLIFWGAEGLD